MQIYIQDRRMIGNINGLHFNWQSRRKYDECEEKIQKHLATTTTAMVPLNDHVLVTSELHI